MTNPYPEYKRTILTTPVEQPQRTWVGLTDKEVDAATQHWAGAVTVPLERLILCREYAKAIEAKLKEKNNA